MARLGLQKTRMAVRNNKRFVTRGDFLSKPTATWTVGWKNERNGLILQKNNRFITSIKIGGQGLTSDPKRHSIQAIAIAVTIFSHAGHNYSPDSWHFTGRADADTINIGP